MKRIIFIIAVLLTAITSFSQVGDVRGKRVIADQSIFLGPSASYGRWVDTIYNDTTNLNGYVRSIPTNNAVYDFVQGRNNSLNTAINLRLLKTDTAAMLAPYTRRTELADTAASLRTLFVGGVSNGDKTDITASGSGLVWTIDNDVVSYAKMQNVSATNRIMGRVTTGAGDMEELTPTQVTSMLNIFTSSLNGLAPSSGGGTTNFLRADGTWAEPPGGGGGGGEANIGSNLGGGLSNYDSKTGITLQFNTFYSSDFDLASNLFKIDYANGQEVSHSVDGFATATQATRWDSVTYFRNTGPTGDGILIEIDDGLLGFKKLIEGTNISFDVADSSITINAGGGGSGRFGYAGEDDAAGENRLFDMDGWDFTLIDSTGNGTMTLRILGDNDNIISIDEQDIVLSSLDDGATAKITISGTTGIEFDDIGWQYLFKGGRIIIDTESTPATAGDVGIKGSIQWDASYIYVCVATDTWKRVAIATW